MKNSIIRLALVAMTAMAASVNAATITVTTTAATGPGSLTAAINALNNGDTINFNIPGAGPHYLITPAIVTGAGGGGGYPEITNNNVTIDGYSQPGASKNTSSIHAANNAQIKIVIDSRAGGGHTWDIQGYGTTESGMFVVSGNNFTVRGLSFLGIPGEDNGTSPKRYGVALGRGADSAHISGCWFGVDPNGTTVAGFADGVTGFTYTGNDKQQDVVVGVKPGSANPRGEFNVFVGLAIPIIIDGDRTHIAGNFLGVLPDGLSRVPNPLFPAGFGWEGHIELASHRQAFIGTDGDGVNDAEEGNILSGGLNTLTSFGTGEKAYPHIIEFYGGSSADRTNMVIAGNYVGVGVDGTTYLTNGTRLVNGLGNGSVVRIGSDFDGVSDALEANLIVNNHPSSLFFDPTTDIPPDFIGADVGQRISVRGNQLINNNLAPYSSEDHGGTRANFTAYEAPYMDTSGSLVPVLTATNVFPHLTGSFPVGINGYTTIILDIYELDPEGWATGALFQFPSLINPFTGGYYGFPQGKKYLGSVTVPNTGSFDITVPAGVGIVTVTANYSQDPAGTHNGRVHTGNFSNPGYVLPAGTTSVGLTQIVPDVACWYDVVGNYVTNGFINLANQPCIVPTLGGPCVPTAALGNWEPYISSLGDSTFLIQFNTFANDTPSTIGDLANVHQNNVVVKQPASGGPAKLDYCFYADNGTPFKGQLNLSRQNGNPGRVAGDLRYGGTKFITEAEVSLGQLAPFQTVARWGNNNIYTGVNRYTAEQIFTLDPYTLVQTPVTNAWDYIYGPFVGVMGAGNAAPQAGRTGGRPNFLDNGNIVIMADDRSAILSSPDGEVITFSIIQPNGTVVKGPTLASFDDIFDNMCAVKGGFVIRAHNALLFYDNSGTLMHSNAVVESSGMTFSDSGGRGDNMRIGGDIRSYYVYAVGAVSPGNHQAGLAIWDTRTGQFVTSAFASDGDPAVQLVDRCGVAVDALDRVAVGFVYKPDPTYPNQVAVRVAQFDGKNINWLTHSFFPFVNHDEDPTNIKGFVTTNPYLAMNTRQICIAAKGTINSTNSASAGPNSLQEQTVYTVISHPAPVAAPRPTVTMTKTGSNLNLSWNAEDGLFTVQTRSSLSSGTWVNATAGNVTPPVTIPAGSGPLFVRLAR